MQRIQLQKTHLLLDTNFLTHEEANYLLHFFLNQPIEFWNQQTVKIFGKTYQSPRKERFICQDTDKSYSYSNNSLKTHPWLNELNPVLDKLNKLGYNFNAVLINYYRDGKDSNGWHADNEKELGEDPVIASLSLGASRKFHLKSKTGAEKHVLTLNHSSLLIMGKGSQIHYKHQLPKMLKLAESRINLTFRQIF
ncbi:MAG: alpha-ketoglutarate-dependent dioxygenase AlkB [Crocinitomicaceae bacterium]|nr:alpha-ketoglutarate-dependent dioxygenase AlkB [Crocinitomicaceae bacterium]